jgi:hypothetical protein
MAACFIKYTYLKQNQKMKIHKKAQLIFEYFELEQLVATTWRS